MNGGSNPLLHCPYGALNFTNMLIGSSKVETDAQEILLKLAKLVVTVNGNDRETFGMIKIDYSGEAASW